MTVIPSVGWAEEETFEFCFRGIEKHGTVSVSSVGVKEDGTVLLMGVSAPFAEFFDQLVCFIGGGAIFKEQTCHHGGAES